MGLKLGNNPLLSRSDDKSVNVKEELILEKAIKQYGRLVHLNKNLLDNIDFEDKKYINRLYAKEEDLEIKDLTESIKDIGLINIIYLQEKEDKKLRIISGLRRATACRYLYEEGFDVKGRDRVVILDSSTPSNFLDSVSVDENIQRKNLSILEQSYKFNREARKKNKKVEDILEEYNISKKSFYRIKNAMNYPESIKDIIDEIGVEKAELINKIIKVQASNKVEDLRLLQRDELRRLLKNLQNKKAKEARVELKTTKNTLNFTIKNNVTSEVKEYFERLKKMIEDDDYSFMS